jgi:diguanylate cyclase (GGDEF)-like protein
LSNKDLKHLLSWIAPGGLVVLAAALFMRYADPATLAELGRGYAYAVFGAAALLAWRFHRSRVLAAVLAVAAADRLLVTAVGDQSVTIYAAVAFFVPLALGTLSITRDRGLMTLRGLTHVGGVLGLVPLVGVLLMAAPGPTAAFFGYTALEPISLEWVALPQLALIAYGVAITLAVGAAIYRGKSVEKSIVWALIATFLALDAMPGSTVSSLYFASAGLVLGLSVVETSYSMAFKDDLTGLPSRRALPEVLNALGSTYTIAMADIDHFKRVNDRHGHDVGDQVLRMVAGQLARVTGGGKPFRYGGEEFTIVFPGKSRAEVIEHLETLREDVEGASFTIRGNDRRKGPKGRGKKKSSEKKLSVTISIGAAERSDRNDTPEKVIRAADKALYRAKQAGRNRVC